MTSDRPSSILITGGAGYIGSLLTAELLADGHRVTVVDRLMFGGDSILPFLGHPSFAFEQRNVIGDDCLSLFDGIDVVFHLAALVGFPACDAAGETVARQHNLVATQRMYEAAEGSGAGRFVFASTYSNYGLARDDRAVTEDSPLFPQSIYAQTKIEAERFLLGRDRGAKCVPVIPRFTTLFGVSPRTRFDLMVNQFVLEALTTHKLVIYQGAYRRSFVHVRDITRALRTLAFAPAAQVGWEVFNVGNDAANHTKAEVVDLVRQAIPDVDVEQRDLAFSADLRDVSVSCAKIKDVLGFRATYSVADGIAEVRDAITSGLIHDPTLPRYRNHGSIVP